MRSGHAAPPISYTSPPAKEILDEDKLIESYKLSLDPKRVEVVPVEQVFQQLPVASGQLSVRVFADNWPLISSFTPGWHFRYNPFSLVPQGQVFQSRCPRCYTSLNVV